MGADKNNEPIYNGKATCPLTSCGERAVNLHIDEYEGDAVTWCEKGHVVVSSYNSGDIPEIHRLVFNFHDIE